MGKRQLAKLLQLHSRFLGGEGNKFRADLSNMDLSGANLSGVDLSEAILKGVNLCAANLRGVILDRADLRKADMEYVLDFRGANFDGADLREANLSGARLKGVTFVGADLRKASLYMADLTSAYFYLANLKETDLVWAKINWDCDQLIAELLYRKAGDDIKRQRLVHLVEMDSQWRDFMCFDFPERDWARSVLIEHMTASQRRRVKKYLW